MHELKKKKGQICKCQWEVLFFYKNLPCFLSNSDDNLLKNIELFDKLGLRFNGRVLFIKDVLGDEICCWSFYGEGRKIAEVCCTSIVYATEKKQTKVSKRDLNSLVYVYKCLFSNIIFFICSHRLSSQKLVSLRRHSTFWSMKMGEARVREAWPYWSQGVSRRQVWASRRRKGQVREAGIGGWGVSMCGGILCMMRGVTDSRLSTKTESERCKDIVLLICMWTMEKLVEERKTSLVCLILHWNGRGGG